MKMITKIDKGRIIHIVDDLAKPGIIYPCKDGKTYVLCIHSDGQNAYLIDITYNYNNRSYVSRVQMYEHIAARVQKEKVAGRL